MKNLRMGLVLSQLLAATAFAANTEGVKPEAPKQSQTQRKDVFEFTQKPTLVRKGDRVTVTFAVKDFCDAAVAIEDDQGRIRRHLAAGVLGANAPEPFQKNSLKQTVTWDGKDDAGKYVDDEGLQVRVSLGLRARYEKDLYYHPKRQLGFDQAVAIDKDGVYVYENNMVDFVKMYDHEAKYVKTIYPFPANKLKDVKGLTMKTWSQGGKPLPVKHGHYQTTLLPIHQGLYDTSPAAGDMAVHRGMLALLGKPRLARIRTDGSSGGLDLAGPKTMIASGKLKGQARSLAISPDGKWIYMARVILTTKCFRGYVRYHPVSGIYRMPYKGVQEPKLFIGEGSYCTMDSRRHSNHKPKENIHFNIAMSVDVDKKGRIYVADHEHNRVQIFSAEGKFLKSIPVVGPCQVMIHRRSGVIYVATWPAQRKGNYQRERDIAYNKYMKKYNAERVPRLRAFKSFDKPELVLEAPIAADMQGFTTKVTLDSWTADPTFWVVQTRGGKLSPGKNGIKVFTEKNGRLVLKNSFDDECKKAGIRQMVPSFQRQFLFFDPKREHLYVGEPDSGEAKIFMRAVRIDVNSGRTKELRLPAGTADAGFDANGHAFLRIGNAICRYNPENWREIPYDYGDERGVSSAAGTSKGRATSAITTPGGGGSSVKYGSFGVSPAGEVIVSCVYSAKPNRTRGGKTKGKRWAPALYPGRPNSMYVHVFDRYGNLKQEDVMKGIGLVTGGLDMDWQGNVFGAVRANGKGMPAHTGALVKFPPRKGRFITAHKPMVGLDRAPNRPRDVGGMWVEEAEWLHFGGSVGSTDHCWCRHGKFKTDYYGRSFIPEYARYNVAVLDPNGNTILRIGQYGNVDSAGPKSLVPLPGDGIGLMDAHFVNMHSDRRLFIADVGNGRIVSAKLGYHKTEKLPLE